MQRGPQKRSAAHGRSLRDLGRFEGIGIYTAQGADKAVLHQFLPLGAGIIATVGITLGLVVLPAANNANIFSHMHNLLEFGFKLSIVVFVAPVKYLFLKIT
jgi:hypothetical protein